MLLHAFDTEIHRYDTNAEMPQSFSKKNKNSAILKETESQKFGSQLKKLEEPRSKIA